MPITKTDFSTGAIQVPDLGSIFRDYSDRQRQREQDKRKQEQQQLANEMAQKRLDIAIAADNRAKQKFALENQQRQILQDVASEYRATPYSSKFVPEAATRKADEAVIDSFESGNMSKLLSDYHKIDDDAKAEEFYLSKIDPINRQLQEQYEGVSPFRKDAYGAIVSEVVARGGDAVKAGIVAKDMTSGLLSKADVQAKYDKEYEAQQDAAKRIDKAKLEAAKLNQKYDNAGSKKYSGSGGKYTSSNDTRYDAIQDVKKMDLGIWDLGDAVSFIDTAVDLNYNPKDAVKSIKNAYNEGLLDKDFDAEEALKYLTKNAPKESSGSKSGGSVNYKDFLTSAGDKKIAGYDSSTLEGNVRGILGERPVKSTATTTSGDGSGFKLGNVDLGKSNRSNYENVNVPDSLLVNEGGLELKSYPDGKKDGLTAEDGSKHTNKAVGAGYNYTTTEFGGNKSRVEVISDFRNSNIPQYKIDAALNNEDVNLTKEEAARLAETAYKRIGVQKAKKVVPDFDNLNPLSKEIVVDLAYRGDLGNSRAGYSRELTEIAKSGDINALVNYLQTSDDVPTIVKNRIGKIITNEGAGSFFDKSTNQEQYEVTEDGNKTTEQSKSLGQMNIAELASHLLSDDTKPTGVDPELARRLKAVNDEYGEGMSLAKASAQASVINKFREEKEAESFGKSVPEYRRYLEFAKQDPALIDQGLPMSPTRVVNVGAGVANTLGKSGKLLSNGANTPSKIIPEKVVNTPLLTRQPSTIVTPRVYQAVKAGDKSPKAVNPLDKARQRAAKKAEEEAPKKKAKEAREAKEAADRRAKTRADKAAEREVKRSEANDKTVIKFSERKKVKPATEAQKKALTGRKLRVLKEDIKDVKDKLARVKKSSKTGKKLLKDLEQLEAKRDKLLK